jgi:hypothetical protein
MLLRASARRRQSVPPFLSSGEDEERDDLIFECQRSIKHNMGFNRLMQQIRTAAKHLEVLLNAAINSCAFSKLADPIG